MKSKVIFRSNLSGEEFETEELCSKHDSKLMKAHDCFEKLVDINFFSQIKIQPFIHNVRIENLGNPSKASWYYTESGYVRMSGRMGNIDTVVKLKIRRNKHLVILIGEFDTKWKYLMSLPLYLFDLEQKAFIDYFNFFIEAYNTTPVRNYEEYLEKRKIALAKLTEEDMKILNIKP